MVQTAVEQNQWLQVLRQMPGAVLLLNGDALQLIFVNDDLKTRLNIPTERLVALSLEDVFPDKPLLKEKLRPILHTGEVIKQTLPVNDSLVNFTFSPWRDANEKITGIIGCGLEDSRTEQGQRYTNPDFKRLADSSPTVLWITDKDGSCSFLSKKWEDLTAQPIAEALGFGWLSALHPDDRENGKSIFQDATYRRIAFTIPYRLRLASGAYAHVLDVGAPRFDTSGEFEGFVGSIVDITVAKDYELELLRTQDLLSKTIAKAPSAIFVFDKDQGMLLANQAAALLYGFDSVAELLQEKNLETMRARATAAWRAFDEQGAELGLDDSPLVVAFRTGKSNRLVRRVVSEKYNKDIWLDSSATPFLNAEGEVTSVLVVANDVTQQKISEEAVKLSKDQLSIALEGGGMGFFDYYPLTGRLISSEKTRELYGLPASEQVPFEAYNNRIHPEDRDAAFAAFSANIDGTDRSHYENEFRIVLPDGRFRWLHSKGKCYRDENGRAYRLSGIVHDVTEEKQLFQSLKLQSLILDQMNEGVSVCDDSGIILLTNEAEDRMFGYAHGALKGRHVSELNAYPPDENDQIVSGVIRQLKLIGFWKGEWYNRRKDGSTFYTASYITTIDIEKRMYFVCVQRDITEEKKAKEALENSEKRFRHIFEGAPVSIWEEDFTLVKKEILALKRSGITDFRHYFSTHPDKLKGLVESIAIRDVNEATLIALEANSKEDFKAGLSEVFVEDSTPAFIDEFALIGEGGGRYEYETILRSKKGNLIEFLVHINFPPLHESYESIMVTLVDISSRKNAEKKIKESETYFRTLTQSLPQFVWTTDRQGMVDFFNDSWYNFTGASLSDSVDNRWMRFLHPEDQQRITTVWMKSLATRKPIRVELRIRRADNTYEWFAVNGMPVMNPEGEVTKWIGAVTNIHDQKITEERLEKTVFERTHELERSNEDLQQFAHATSHDLKEPLRKIMIFAHRVIEEHDAHLPARVKDYISRILTSGKRMTSMIDGVLTYSKLNATAFSTEEVDLNMLLKEIMEDLDLLITQQGAEVTMELRSSIFGTRVLLYQLFYNLINNAIKFRRPGVAPQIIISEESRGDMLEIVVKDNGIGFDPEYEQVIFHAFARLHSKQDYEGTGLGLSLCKKIVERHRGNIKAIGRPNEGASFIVMLPKKIDSAV